jgi:hypothetical protein
VERRRLPLRRLLGVAEHLGRRSLVEARLGADVAHGFEQARHAERGDLRRQHGSSKERGTKD